MKVEYEPDGLRAVQALKLDPIQFAAAVQKWVNQNQENINPNGGTCTVAYAGRNYQVTYTVNNNVFFITNVT